MKRMLDKIEGVLLGTAVGDAIGLPREGLSRRRAFRMYAGKPLRHKFFFGKGMCSDDTEHICMVAQALLSSQGDPEKFARSLSWKLRFWLLAIPAGVGLATLKGICKLWLGFSPDKSGVHSAGNGPAMRSALLGMYAGNDIDYLKILVRASTRLTHVDERAEQGALAVALAAQYVSSRSPEEVDIAKLFKILDDHITNSELCNAFNQIHSALNENMSSESAAEIMGLHKGISGYIVYTVPMAMFCWLRNINDFQAAVEDVVLLGGDTDTTGAITGALAGAAVGGSGIPQEWLENICEWPRSITWMRRLSKHIFNQIEHQVESDSNEKSVRYFWPGLIIRNIIFLTIVLAHGLRRLFPPY